MTIIARIKLLSAAGTAAVAIALGGLIWDTGPAFADFVCPVLPISEEAFDNSDAGFAEIGGGDYSIITTIVPENETPNNNTGSPPGDHGVPGESDYTAIWDQDVDPTATKNPQD